MLLSDPSGNELVHRSVGRLWDVSDDPQEGDGVEDKHHDVERNGPREADDDWIEEEYQSGRRAGDGHAEGDS